MGLINSRIQPSQIDKRESDCSLTASLRCLLSKQVLVFWMLEHADIKAPLIEPKESRVKPLLPHIRKMIKEATDGFWLLIYKAKPQQMIVQSCYSQRAQC